MSMIDIMTDKNYNEILKENKKLKRAIKIKTDTINNYKKMYSKKNHANNKRSN